MLNDSQDNGLVNAFPEWLEDAPSALLVWNTEGRVLHVNIAAAGWLNRPAVDIEGDDINEVLGKHVGAQLRAPVAAAQATGEPQRFTLTSDRTPEAATRRAQLWRSEWNGAAVVVLMVTINEGEAADDVNLREVQRLESLGLMAGGIAHDFNNVLVAMLGYAELALEAEPGQEVEEMLREVIAAAERASELSSQLLAYSGRGKFIHVPVDLREVADSTTRLLRASVPQNRQLFVSSAEDALWTEGDPAQLRQVILNLVTNASDALESVGGFVDVRVERERVGGEQLRSLKTGSWLPAGDYIVVTVEDDGCGMSADMKDRIFEPFFTTKERGRGLGLAATLGIVEGHGGTLNIESEPGRGTAFTVHLPASDWEEPVTEEKPPQTTVSLSRRFALIVDDNQSVRDLTGRVLKAHGYTVTAAEGGLEALAWLDRTPVDPDVVLLDLIMPGMSGQETLREIRLRRPKLPVVLTTGYTTTELSLQHTATESFIKKPFGARALVDTLSRAVDTAAGV